MSLTQVAQDLGMNQSMLRRWRNEANLEGPQAFRGQDFSRDEELAQLKGNHIFYRIVDPCVPTLLHRGICLVEDTRES